MRIALAPGGRRIVAMAALTVAVFGQAPVTIRMDADAPRVAVSPHLYGIFFEEINHAGEGGLYAEMVLNRDFETVNLPAGARWAGNLLRTKDDWQERKWFGNELHGWKLTAEGGARGSIRLDTAKPLNRNNPHSMRLSIRQAGRRAGVVNGGFSGMNFQAGKAYDLTFYARTEGGEEFDIRASLESASGREAYATAAVRGAGGGWKQYRCTLTPKQSDANGRLALLIDRAGTLWFDVVSLFPRDTFKGRPNGMRSDLAQALADLKPAFIRFPGGAVVGGLNLDNRFQWKRSIGDIAQRQGTMNLWGYYSTNGLGFHEYLQLAEDIGADALYVCNPGFSDNYRHAEYAKPEEVAAFVEEALDALEYALGPVTSKWGAERAKNGHAAPFRLRYIEVGNEASTKEYRRNYPLFYEAIRRKYPDLTIIANQRKLDAPMEMVDDHIYGPPARFFADSSKYDAADRNGPKVYVGEYGCNREVGEGTLMAALAEAAYLMGLERNSDVVRMSSYAPLFFHVDDIAWPVNLIGFDSSRVALRTSYHVQKLFSQNRPDEVLKTEVEPKPAGDVASVYALAGWRRAAGEVVIKMVNPSGAARTAQIEVRGIARLGSKARVTTLAHSDPAAENTVDEPDAVLPVTREIAVRGTAFPLTLPPYSLTMVNLPATAR